MSWSSTGYSRNINILALLNSGSGSNPIEIYRPGTLNPASLAPKVRYSGCVTTLRLTVDVTSITETIFPEPSEDETAAELQAAIRAIETNSPKKKINLLLRRGQTQPIKIASIFLFNRSPYYVIDLLPYYTDALAWDLGSDMAMMLQLESVGYGLLEGNDTIAVYGSSVEEGENSTPITNIYFIGGAIGGGGGGSVIPNTIVTNNAGEPLTNNAGEIITSA